MSFYHSINDCAGTGPVAAVLRAVGEGGNPPSASVNATAYSGMFPAKPKPLSADDRIAAIQACFRKGRAHTLELARLLALARSEMRHGEWTKLWHSRRLPFSKRKGYLLVAVGNQLGPLDPDVSDQLPAALATLYHLAKFKRAQVISLVAQGAIHPDLTETEAQALAQDCGVTTRLRGKPSAERRVRRFCRFVRQHRDAWTNNQQAFVAAELEQLLASLREWENRNVQDAAHLPRSNVPDTQQPEPSKTEIHRRPNAPVPPFQPADNARAAQQLQPTDPSAQSESL